jgi:transposase
LRSGVAEVPEIDRPDLLTPHVQRVRQLHAECGGNLVRVAEELLARHGVRVGYSTLTAFCRRHDIGVKPKQRAGRYHFEPGQEMQHDTSPHTVKIGGQDRHLQCASLVMCYSRSFLSQDYPTFNRFYCKVFLTEALKYLGGAAAICMIDNTSVIVDHGSGKDAVPAPELEVFAARFGFEFEAHDKGDANRSARVERRFHYIENNFYRGRTFDSLEDLNRQMCAWCDQVNRTPKTDLGGFSPAQLLVAERPDLRPLPPYIPDVYELHVRRVDVEGYVCVHTNRYSVPSGFIGRQVEIRESINRIRVFDGHRLVVEHERVDPGLQRRVTLPEHRHPGRRRWNPPPPLPEERTLRAAAPELSQMVDVLRKRHGGRAARSVRQLHRIYLDYPTEPIIKAIRTALAYGMHDLARIEQMILRNIAGDFFRLPVDDTEEDDDG